VVYRKLQESDFSCTSVQKKLTEKMSDPEPSPNPTKYALEMFRRCLHRDECSHETMNKLYDKLPKMLLTGSYDMFSDPKVPEIKLTAAQKFKNAVVDILPEGLLKPDPEAEITPREPIAHKLSVKSYIESTRTKENLYSDYPPMLDTPKDVYYVNANTLAWFFARGERLDYEDTRRILSTNSFSRYSLGFKILKEILEHSDTKSTLVLNSICDAHGGHAETVQLLNKYIDLGSVPTKETFDKCVQYRSNKQALELLEILQSSKFV
jgi:hypothetical protein